MYQHSDQHSLLHRLFFAQAERTPDREAVVCGEDHLTYAELAWRAARLAETLRRLGAAPEVPVGICARRTPDLIAGMLGILASGSAYLPLDPRYPRERLSFMLEDAGAPLVLTDEASAAALPETGARLVFLDREMPEGAAAPVRQGAEPRNLAYLIYTSGSTGRPKGVAIPHGAAVHLMEWARGLFPPEELAGVLAATSVCFDLSVFEIFVPLSWGGRVILADNALALPTLPAAGEVTLVNTVPSAAAELVRGGGFPPSVRTINLAGEALKRPLVDQLYERTRARSVFNLYGPSEDTTYSTWARVPRGTSEAPTIGVPLPEESAQVLDAELRPAAPGHEGELFLGGPALARGYLGRPDLTAERFLPDPAAAAPGARMYRTGDLVRHRPDGELDFLGRLDHQVKIRGFRIELGEIEAALLLHPAVRESVVVARGGGEEGGAVLVAYLSGDLSTEPAGAAELRRFLGERLPEHMIPSLFVLLPALPLTPNGKVNRKALPAPDPRQTGSALYVAPRTPLEERLAALWGDALGLRSVGVEDNFFEMGGHSLLGTRLLWRLREEAGIEGSLRDLMERPTVAAFAALLEGEPAAGRVSALPPLRAVPRDRPLPLTSNQLRLWLLQEQRPDDVAYNVPVVCRLEGRLSASALGRALEEIVGRHEALRTTFTVAEGAPVQVIYPAGPLPLPVIDLSGLSRNARREEAERIALEDSRAGFELERGPVLRCTLLRLEPERHRLLLTVHHIAWDEWSAEVFLRELTALYRAFLEGRAPALPALALQVADYGIWQNAWSREAAGESLLGWWRERLASLPEPLELPGDRPRPPFQSGRGGRRWRVLPEELCAGARELARGAGVTPYMTFLAAFAALLGRITGRDDLVIGGLIAGRTRPESEALIGFLTNTVLLRVPLSGAPGFGGLLAAVREVVLGAMEHQDLPFDRVFEAVGPELGDRLRVLYTYYQQPAQGVELAPGLDFGWSEADNGTAKLDLTLFVEERERGFALSAEYSADLFDPSTVDRLLERLETLLADAVATPEADLADLPLLTAGEQEQLAAWNVTRREYPRDAGLWDLFAAVASRAPEAVALELGAELVTYGELRRRAERLAGRLRAAGVRPGTAVGLCCERSAGLVEGMLGILRAGGFYVPLEPSHPRERLRWALRISRARVLVTQEALIHALPAELTAALSTVIVLEREPLEAEAGEGVSMPGDALAYAIFTSGSTGRPKGVAVPQRAVARLVLGTDYVELGPELRMGQVSNAAFDAITYEVWGALLHGGRLVGIERDVALDPQRLAAALRDRRIGSTFLTAALFHQMAREQPDAFSGMDQLLVGGDAVDPEAARAVLAAGPPRRLINGYGPTECTTFAVCGPIAAVPEGARSVPIGRPIANTTAWVLDRNLCIVPVGVPGELCLGGDGLAWGYLERPDLTASRFAPHPYGEPGERLYQTGDLVRWRQDGLIEFLGRVDNQVKIRGFRIEPGEIEVMLCAHPAVHEVAVVPFEASPGDRRLAAFVVGREGAPDIAELRAFLDEQLPEFMIPSAFIPLEALPLNPNGKVDRRALGANSAALRAAAEAARTGYVPPRTALEEVLAGIWEEVLDAGRVGAHDDFFDLGGHSLLITRVLSRVRQALEIDLPPRALFEAPTVAALAERIAGAGLADRLPPIETLPRGGDLPLSPAQQRLWFLERLEGGTAYNIPLAWRLRGALDAGALRAALGDLLERHEALRAIFAESDGEPVVRVTAGAEPAMAVVDLRALPAEAREPALRSLLRAEATLPFDLRRGPLLRSFLARLADDEQVWMVDLHHIVADGWSVGVLCREVSHLYAARAGGFPAQLPALPVQYADFAAWQRGWLETGVLEPQLAWWRERLAGLEVLDLPTDRPRPPVRSHRGASRRRPLPAGLRDSVAGLGRERGATRFMILLAATAALLERYTGRGDVAVGSPMAGRTRPEIESLIGLFVNTLVLRVDAGDEPSFTTLLARVREATLGAFAHQDLPFERLVEVLRPDRNLGHNPLFEVMFSAGSEPIPVPELPRVGACHEEVEIAAVKLDLSLAVQDSGASLDFVVDYDADLFDAASIDRLAACFETLLAAALARPESTVADLPLLSAEEREQLQAEWTAPPPPMGEACLHELFAAQAERTPDALALRCGAEELTYGELRARSARLAGRLRALGVGAEVPVGVCLRRTPDLIVALLGVLEAGGAYVPLDPAYPADRLAFTLQDSGAPVLLTEERWRGLFPGTAARIVTLDGAEEGGAVHSGGAGPDNLAYVIYTSGSTGRPKGVAITHRSAAALVRWALGAFAADELAAVFAATSVCFDLSVFEIFVPLACGGAVVLGENALALPAAGEVTLVNSVPSALAELVEADAVPSSVRVVNLAGEPLPRALADRIHAIPTVRRVLNLYGPTEDTTYSTAHEVARADRGEPSIGRPLPGTRGYVLDARQRLLPAGVPGELLLAGEGLARGYLGRPELTAERFLPDPHGPLPGARMYRTGDLVRRRGGELAFLGRIDHQVKVRGFRIELGEIEAVLCADPAVRQAVALVRGDGGERSLVAYVEAAEAAEPSAEELRGRLGERLPAHMIPSAFVVLPSFPLLPNGKVDRRALARVAPEVRTGGSEPPRTEAERKVAAVWSELLGVERIGVDDKFFDLGGHSLLLMRASARLRAAFGVELSLVELFRHPDLRSLARRLDEAGNAAPAERIPPRPAGARTDRFPVSFSQLRLWLLDWMEPGTPAYNMPLPLLLEGPLDPAALERALAETVRRHEGLRTVFTLEATGSEPVQRVLPPWDLALPRIDLSALPEAAREAETDRLIDQETRIGFDLSRGPLVRASLVRHGAERHALLLTLHHIVSDGWSLGVWFREIAALYEAFAAGRPSPLPELPIQYPDFAVWQRRHLQGERLEELLGYWRRQLVGASTTLDLPSDRPRPPIRSSRGAHEQFRIEEELAAGIRELARSADATPFMVLLAAWQTLLSRFTGQEDVSAGTFIANRTRPEVEGLIGFFVNTLVLHTDLGGEPGFGELLGRVREVTFGAYAHQELPLERLIEEMQPPRDPSRTPLFQVMLVLQNVPEMRLRLPELTIGALPLELRRSNFDLTLWFDPDGDGFAGDAEYATALFDAATVRRFTGHLRHLLAAAVAAPETPIARLPLLGEEERRQLLVEWNDTGAWLGADVPVHLRIREQARRTPDAPAVAVVTAGESAVALTYGELDRRAEELAVHLRALGAGPERIVGLAMRRSPEQIVGLLGILYAGAAYVPLDPDYPRERLALMLRHAAARVVLADASSAERIPTEGLRLIRMDEPLPPADRAALAPLPRVDPAHPVYVIFTSGSTGVPKGVVVTHGGLANHTASVILDFELRPADRWLQFFSISFDSSAEEIYPVLAAGATLVLRDDSMITSAADFLRAVDRMGITVLDLATAFWHELAAGMERSGATLPPAVRLVIFGGEKALADRMESWFRAGGGRARLVNTYGPTEATIVAARHDLFPGMTEAPIGRPIHNLRTYVADPLLQVVPIGVPGELYLGGAGLARGYLGRPDLTAERFVPDPFSGEAGSRLYRTGDLVRWRLSQDLEFLGRVDRQVKIRGFRVEVGEVEKALRQHPGLADGLAATREDASGSHRLVAWVVPAGASVLPEDLRAWLRERLPDYMVPSVFVAIPEVPLTPNGKIDRKALPEPESLRGGTDADYAPPQSEMERIIAGIWQQVLGVERVGLHDSFFELGGHSLLVMKAHGLLRDALRREIDIILLFQRPTVSALAKELRQADEKPAFAGARELVMRQGTVQDRRKQMMEEMMRQRRKR